MPSQSQVSHPKHIIKCWTRVLNIFDRLWDFYLRGKLFINILYAGTDPSYFSLYLLFLSIFSCPKRQISVFDSNLRLRWAYTSLSESIKVIQNMRDVFLCNIISFLLKPKLLKIIILNYWNSSKNMKETHAQS